MELIMKNIPFINDQEWKPAVYNGMAIKNLLISNYGLIRRIKNGIPGQVTRGTPVFHKNPKTKQRGRLSMFEACVTFIDAPAGVKTCRAVNVDRIACCTFKGDFFNKGFDVDHIDRDVENGFVGTAAKNYTDGNLRCVTRSENMKNQGARKPRTGIKCPVASEFQYKIKLQLGLRNIAEFPRAYIREYRRLRYAELHGLPAIPRTINLRDGKQNVSEK